MKLKSAALSYYRDLRWTVSNVSGWSDFFCLAADFTSHRLGRFRNPTCDPEPRTARLRGGMELHYRRDRCDIWTIHEVWVDESYRISPPDGVRRILDIGANIGLTSLWLSQQFPDAEIVAVEPVIANAEVARKNFKANGIRGDVIRAAVSDHEGTASFASGGGATNGRLLNLPDRGVVRTDLMSEVPLITMETILKRWTDDLPIDLVKMDIEGGEDALIKDEAAWLDRVRVLIIEFHPQLANYPRMLGVLAGKGFRCVSKTTLDRNTLEVFACSLPIAVPLLDGLHSSHYLMTALRTETEEGT